MESRHITILNVSLLALLAAASAAIGGAARASEPTAGSRDLPAVSALNAKIGAFGTNLDDDTGGGAFAALALPLGRGFGAQFDGMAGSLNGGNFYGVGGHLFWRDPTRALFGIYASHVRWDVDSVNLGFGHTEVGKVGVEGQLYLGRLSLEGLAAYQFGTETGFAGKGVIAYYPRDDIRLHLGITHLEGPGATAFAGLEWAPMGTRGFSLFADVGVNEDNDVRSLFGLKLYLSPQEKSLIRRHREDDPDVDLPTDLFQARQGNHCAFGMAQLNGYCDGNI